MQEKLSELSLAGARLAVSSAYTGTLGTPTAAQHCDGLLAISFDVCMYHVIMTTDGCHSCVQLRYKDIDEYRSTCQEAGREADTSNGICMCVCCMYYMSGE